MKTVEQKAEEKERQYSAWHTWLKEQQKEDCHPKHRLYWRALNSAFDYKGDMGLPDADYEDYIEGYIYGHAAALEGKIAVEKELLELLIKATRIVKNLAVSEGTKEDARKLIRQAEALLREGK